MRTALFCSPWAIRFSLRQFFVSTFSDVPNSPKIEASCEAAYLAHWRRSLLRKRFWVDSGNEFEGVFVVDLFECFVVELKAIDAPERVALAVVLEIFVPGFERAEIPLVFVHVINVLAH